MILEAKVETVIGDLLVPEGARSAAHMGKSITDLSSVTTVGLDLAKHVFQVHGVDASGLLRAIAQMPCWP